MARRLSLRAILFSCTVTSIQRRFRIARLRRYLLSSIFSVIQMVPNMLANFGASEVEAIPYAEVPFPIHLRMAESLCELQRALQTHWPVDQLGKVIDHLRAGSSLEPAAYAAYFSLIKAVDAGRYRAVARLLATIASSPRPKAAAITVRMLSVSDFGRRGLREAKQHFTSATLSSSQLRPINGHAAQRTRRAIEAALDLVRETAPRSWEVLSAITCEIIATRGIARASMTFDGCSSLERFGSILVNMNRARTPLVLAETLVHESAHSLLFALSCHDHRVLNPATELHQSPLRIDPRPLDGIYHAVFVLARMHDFLVEVALGPNTAPAIRDEAIGLVQARQSNFFDGYAVLAEHARLTPIGRELLDGSLSLVQAGAARLTLAHPHINAPPRPPVVRQ